MTMRERWIDLLYRAATSTRRIRTLLTPVGLAIFAGFTTGFVIAAVWLDRLLGLPPLVNGGAQLVVSLVLLASGVGLTAWSAAHFLLARGTPVPFAPPPRIVATGPYRHVRNPMLTGVFLFLFGLGFALGSASLVLVFVPLYILFNLWELKRVEEPELAKRLGDSYLEYRRRTPMFVPRLRRPRR